TVTPPPASSANAASAPAAAVREPAAAPPRANTPAPPTGATANGASANAASGQAERSIYTAEDVDVTPPVDVAVALPRYTPPPAAFSQLVFRGTLAVVVNEKGEVESAELVKAASALYDNVLLKAARQWRFKPAMRNGKPVKFRKIFDLVLRPAG